MSERAFDADEIKQYLREVAEELPPTIPPRTVVIVGGALLALRGFRDATRDVDSVEHLDPELQDAIERVAARHGLAPRWLNHSAIPFRPATFANDDCDVLLDEPGLRVLCAPLDQVFLMKLYASRATDTDDLEAIWPDCSFGSPEAAVESFYNAYPHEERDPFLAAHLRNLI